MFNKNFWKAYGLTLLQALLIIILSVAAYLLIYKSTANVYPLLMDLQEMGQTNTIDNQLLNNLSLYNNFVFYLIAIILSYTLLVAGVLSLFDILIIKQLEHKTLKDWLFEWFRYSEVSLLFLITIYTLFYNLTNMLYLTILVVLVSFIYCYTLILMQFNLSIKNTILRALLLFVLYCVLFIISLVLIGLLKWYGFITVFLLFIFLLLWSKIYLMKRL